MPRRRLPACKRLPVALCVVGVHVLIGIGFFQMTTSPNNQMPKPKENTTAKTNLQTNRALQPQPSHALVSTTEPPHAMVSTPEDFEAREPQTSHVTDTNGASLSVQSIHVGPAGSMHRDCNLQGLVDLLNTFPNWTRMRRYGERYYERLVDHLVPWIVAEPGPAGGSGGIAELDAMRPPVPNIDCKNPGYQSVFSGRRLQSSRPIVDIVPFAYDLSLLELRLIEGSEAVDLFVVSESDVTQRRVKKPRFFDMAKDQPRFARFRHKILHVVVTGSERLRTHPSDWVRETVMRRYPVACLAALLDIQDRICSGGSAVNISCAHGAKEKMDGLVAPFAVGPWGIPKKAFCNVAKHRGAALVQQNDEDEIATRRTLWHLKHCELTGPDVPISAPAVLHRGNVQWVSGKLTEDYACLGPEMRFIGGALWFAGPSFDSLQAVLQHGTTTYLRLLVCSGTREKIRIVRHLGPSAAFHLSGTTEPVQMWLKAGYVLETDGVKSLMPEKMITAGSRAGIDASVVLESLNLCPARKMDPLAHISTFSAAAQDFIMNARPWAMRKMPHRYCFQDPMPARSQQNHLMSHIAHWHQSNCQATKLHGPPGFTLSSSSTSKFPLILKDVSKGAAGQRSTQIPDASLVPIFSSPGPRSGANCQWPDHFKSTAQLGEDRYLYENYFCGMQGGIYAEMGAYDGKTWSNTRSFERAFRWQGVLIEAGPAGKAIAKNRNSKNNYIILKAACPATQQHVALSFTWDVGVIRSPQKAVPCEPLGTMLRNAGVPRIDFFSLDVEGHEIDVLETMDWSIPVGVWIIELWGPAGVAADRLQAVRRQGISDPVKEERVVQLLDKNGYVKTGAWDCNAIFEHPTIRKNRKRNPAVKFDWGSG